VRPRRRLTRPRHGAEVVVTEIDAIRALEAAMDGYRVMPMKDAARVGDVFVTVTGDMHVVRGEHFPLMKTARFSATRAISTSRSTSKRWRKLAKRVAAACASTSTPTCCETAGGLFVLGRGAREPRAAEGHPPDVMDMSFADAGARHALGGRAEAGTRLAVQVAQRAARRRAAGGDGEARVPWGIRIDRLTRGSSAST